MKRKFLKFFLVAFLSVLILLAVLALLYTYTPVVDRGLEKTINQLVGPEVSFHYRKIEGNLLRFIRLKDVEVTFDGGKANIPEMVLRYDAIALTGSKIRIDYLFLQSPSIQFMEKSVKDTLPTASPPPQPLDSLFHPIDLSGLPEIYLRKLVIRDGKITIGTEKTENRIEKINLELNAHLNDRKVEAQVRYLRAEDVLRDIRLKEATFHLLGNPKRVTLNQLELFVDNSRLIGHGELELQPHFRFLLFADTSQINVALLRKFLPDFPYRRGFVRFAGNYIGNPNYFNGEFFVTGRLDSLQFRQIRFRYAYKRGEIFLKQLRFSTNFGRVQGEAQISPVGKNSVNLHFRRINLKKIGIFPASTQINGWVRLNFNTWNFSRNSGLGRILLHDVVIDSSRIDTVWLKVRLQRGNWEMQKGSRLVLQKQSQFFLEGTFSRHHRLRARLFTDDNSLDTLAQRLRIPGLGGTGSLELTMEGYYANPSVGGYFLLDSLRYQDVVSYGVEGQFRVEHIARERIGYFNLELSSGLVAGVELTDGDVQLKIARDTVRIDTLAFYNGDNFVLARGRIARISNRLDLRFHEFSTQYGNYVLQAQDTLEAVFTGDSLIIENFLLNAPGKGEIEARGLVAFTGNSELGIYLKNIQLEPFNQFLQLPVKVQGSTEISLIFYGNPQQPEVETELELNHLVLNADTVGNFAAELVYLNRHLEVRKLRITQSDSAFLNVSGMFAFHQFPPGENFRWTSQDSLEINLNLHQVALRRLPLLRRFHFPFQGEFSGTMELHGPVTAPLGVFSITASQIRYQDYRLPFVKLEGRISPRDVILDYARINMQGSLITARGRKPILWDPNNPEHILQDQRFMVYFRVQEDSINFLNVLSPEVDLLTGDIQVEGTILGTFQKYAWTKGKVTVHQGTLYLSKVENPLTALEVEGEVNNGVLRLTHARGFLRETEPERNFFRAFLHRLFLPVRRLFRPAGDRGEVLISGTVDLNDLAWPRLNLQVRARSAYVNYFIENASLMFSTKNLTITGQDTILVAGDVEVEKALVELDIAESEKNLLLSPTIREIPPYMRYRVNLSIPGNFYVRSESPFNSFEIQLAGDLKIFQEPNQLMEMYGNLDVLGGKYFQFEEFNVSSGRIEFVNPKELPQLDLRAEKRKYNYIFELHVSGKLNNPVKEIRIFDLKTGEDVTHLFPETKDKIALLLFGVTFNQLTSSAGSVILEKGQEVINQALISQIEREARHFIGLDQVRLETQEGLIDFKNRRLNRSLEDASLSLGKYLTPKLYLEYKTRLASAGLPGLGQIPAPRISWEAGNQIYLEYRINRNWSVSTYYEKSENDKIKIEINWRHSF